MCVCVCIQPPCPYRGRERRCEYIFAKVRMHISKIVQIANLQAAIAKSGPPGGHNLVYGMAGGSFRNQEKGGTCIRAKRDDLAVCLCFGFLALGGRCLQMLCLPGFGTHANTQKLPHFRAFPANIRERSHPKCLFFMANAKLPNRPEGDLQEPREQGRKKYTPPPWRPSFFSFSGSEALW